MPQRLRALLRLLRPTQHYKAGIIWLPAFFHGLGAFRTQAPDLVGITLVWILAASLVYVLNDVADLESDRHRSDRLHRPLASGALSRGHALAYAGFLALLLALALTRFPGRLALLVGIYLLLNLGYSLGLKRHLGLQQAIIALGFWLRLQSGADPMVSIPLTPWASLFTLGLAYYLNCMKGLHRRTHEAHRPFRFAMGLGAGLAGSLALAALVAICLRRGLDGSLRLPELPPLFCLVGMHRVAFQSWSPVKAREQSSAFFGDWVTLGAMALFALVFIWG
ncbi:UbiA family prenyltransferase [Holophaga foetida]|uniref:UbiA family prenyltransferase n=1 Tax=Holophaga foetida TaxID=35839 RepID=UPI0002474260|nr:UbiA family prenyltransferase [Holophaga foetida]